MRFLLRSAFWLGLVFHAMFAGDARVADVVPSAGQTLIAGLASQNADTQAATTIARAVLRATLEPQASNEAKPATSVAPAAKAKRASVDTLSVADRQPPWRGSGLRGTL